MLSMCEENNHACGCKPTSLTIITAQAHTVEHDGLGGADDRSLEVFLVQILVGRIGAGRSRRFTSEHIFQIRGRQVERLLRNQRLARDLAGKYGPTFERFLRHVIYSFRIHFQ